MANPEHVEIVKQGAAAIAAWRAENPGIPLDLRDAHLSGRNRIEADPSEAHLSGTDLNRANLRGIVINGADLTGADLSGADLIGAVLCNANLHSATLFRAELRATDLSESNLFGANLSKADLSAAKLRQADLIATRLNGTNLSRTDLRWAKVWGCDLNGANVERSVLNGTVFANVDLSEVRGLDSVRHDGPSTIGVDTLYKSQGKIPEVFLRGCGVPEALITYLPSLIGAMEPIQFQSCFISYSSKDDEFARRLYGRMRDEKLRVWFAPEDMQGGKKSIEQIDRAIQVNDRLLLVLSKHSMNSEWVRREIKRARATERTEKRTKLFPIALSPFTMIKKWRCDDADTGEDLAEKIRENHIPDFSNWKNHDAFEAAFAKLLRDLRAEA